MCHIVAYVTTVGYDDQFKEEKKSPVIFFLQIMEVKADLYIERGDGCTIPFRFRLTHTIRCKHAKISDLMENGASCHPVISECPFNDNV